MTYFVLWNDKPLPDDSFTKPLEFRTREEAEEFITDLDDEYSGTMSVLGTKNPAAIRDIFRHIIKK